MDAWKKSFSEKLSHVHWAWIKQFDQVLESTVSPVFDELTAFLKDNGFQTSIPLRENGHRSFKFELAEDAYLLVIFRSSGLGQFELSRECVVPGNVPIVRKSIERLSDLDSGWARQQIQAALNSFVELLGGASAPAEEEAVATV